MKLRFTRSVKFGVILVILSTLPVTLLNAQSDIGNYPVSYVTYSSSSTSPAVKEIQTSEFGGKIIKIENNQITIESGDITKVISLPNNISILKDNKNASLKDFIIGDSLTVTFDSQNQIIKASGMTQNLLDNVKLIALLIVVALFIMALIYFLISRGKKSHIRTMPTNI